MWKIESERADLFDVNMMITISVKATGTFFKNQIIDAFNAAVKSYEILNTKVVIDASFNAFYEVNDKQNNKLLFTDKSLKKLILENEKNRFHIEDGEFLRLFVSLEDNSFTFMLHHLGGDGKSLLYFIESFFRCLNGEKLNFNNIKLLNKDTLPMNSKLPFLVKLFVNHYNRKWQKEKTAFTFNDLDKAFNDFWESHKTKIEIESIDKVELCNILDECKKNDVGYTSYDIANRIKDKSNIQDIGLAVDGRDDKNRTMSNQATGISIKYKYDNTKSIFENAKIINRLMRKKLNNIKYKYFILQFMSMLDPTLVDAVNLEFSGYFHAKTSSKLAEILGYCSKTKDLSITNLTKVDIKTEYDNYKIEEIIFVPPVVSYGKSIIGIVTTNNKLISTKHYYDN